MVSKLIAVCVNHAHIKIALFCCQCQFFNYFQCVMYKKKKKTQKCVHISWPDPCKAPAGFSVRLGGEIVLLFLPQAASSVSNGLLSSDSIHSPCPVPGKPCGLSAVLHRTSVQSPDACQCFLHYHLVTLI